jgi:hypothetical protein
VTRHLEGSLRARHWIIIRPATGGIGTRVITIGWLYLKLVSFVVSRVTLTDQCELKALPQKGIQNTYLFLSNRFHFLLNILNLNRLNQANVGGR